MSIPHALLALLDQQPMHGYQLRSEFEAVTGATWPLNLGQVYTTLGRLQRDACVAVRQAQEDASRQVYEITPVGSQMLDSWWSAPVELADRPRDELAIKLSLAAASSKVDLQAVVQRQRASTMRRLQELTRLKQGVDRSVDLAWVLLLDNLRFQADAELRWLDHCESTVAEWRSDSERGPKPAPVSARPAPDRARAR